MEDQPDSKTMIGQRKRRQSDIGALNIDKSREGDDGDEPDNAPSTSRTISRWRRRRSDGGAFDIDASFGDDEDGDGRNGAPDDTHNTRNVRESKRTLLAWWRDLANYEPVHITSDFLQRIAAASRASVASVLVFSILVATGKQQVVLPAIWIGNVLTQATLKSNLGATAVAVKNVVVPLIPVASLSWAIAVGLDACGTRTYSFLLPVVVVLGSAILFMCPWPFLTSKNVMLVVFYLIVASPLASVYEGPTSTYQLEPLSPWFAPSFVGTCFVGLSIPLVIHVLLALSHRPTTASSNIPILLSRLSSDTNQLLLSVADFLSNIGTSPQSARQARARIKLFVHTRRKSLADLKGCVEAFNAEGKMRRAMSLCRRNRIGDGLAITQELQAIGDYVALMERQQAHAELIQLATTQQLLGEDFTMRSKVVRELKIKISQNLGSVVQEMAFAFREAQRMYLFEAENDKMQEALEALQLYLQQYRAAMKRAITEAETILINDPIDTHMESTVAPLIRVRVMFHSLYSLVTEVSDAMEATGTNCSNAATKEKQIPIWSRIRTSASAPWQWNDWAKRRMAFKSAVGLGLASLFVSNPYLRENIAHPNSIWPGATVASVNLETTGAAYQKCMDRLWGTLAAAAFCLLIGRFFPENDDVAKILSIGAFTFLAIFLQNPKRPYSCQYAASSVGSILYGSLDISANVEGYVPNRIMLIFIGIVIFLLVECLIFPRSSRTVVQAKTIQFFEDTEQFLLEARKVVDSISMLRRDNSEEISEIDVETKLMQDPLWMLHKGQKEMVSLADGLYEAAQVVELTLSEAWDELEPGINEPSTGLNATIDANGYRALLQEQRRCHAQFQILITSIQSLIGYYSTLEIDSSIRSLHWPLILSSILAKSVDLLSTCCDGLQMVFPNGLCRPIPGQSIAITVKSISKFRSFEDVRLLSLTEWSDCHSEYLHGVKLTGRAITFAPGFRLTLALAICSTLEIDRCLQNCGEYLEQIVQSFPRHIDEALQSCR